MNKLSRFSGFTASGGGSGGAPVNASYLVLGADGILTSERVFVPGTTLAAVDGGAGGNYTVDLALVPGVAGTYAHPSSLTADAYGRVTAVTAGTAPFVPGPAFLLAYFGCGYDGNVTIAAGTTTLSREMQYNNLTIQAGATLKPAGNRIFVLGVLTIEAGGSINDNGNNATGLTGGGSLTPSGYLRTLCGGGSNGRATTGTGQPTITGSFVAPNNAGVTPIAGNGGTAGGANAGGVAASNNLVTPSQAWHTQAVWGSARASVGAFSGGGGGAGGGCDATGGTATSGGGGGSAGVVWVAAHNVSNLGTISANGGNGGNAVQTLLSSAGGGGGGTGGLVAVISASGSAAVGSITATGGSGGTGAGPAGAAGAAGTGGATTFLRLA